MPPYPAFLQEWEGHLQRAYILHKARLLHEGTAIRQHAPAASVAAYLRPRADKNKPMPRVAIVERHSMGGQVARGAVKRILEAGGEEVKEENNAMVAFVVKDLAAELYTELMAGFHH
jgi:hypothetical protein